MNIRCKFCSELLDEAALKSHLLEAGSQCRSALETIRLLGNGLRPFPVGHTLPDWMQPMIIIAKTRAKYDGEPRYEQGLLAAAEEQHWVPRWIDVVTELWAGPIYVEGERRRLQRDLVLKELQTQWSAPRLKQIVDASKEGLLSVRELLKRGGAIIGDPPMMLKEFEDLGRFKDKERHAALARIESE